MAATCSVPASEFSRNFARYRDVVVEAGIIRVTSRGRVIGAWLSAGEAARYERLQRRERQSLRVGALPGDVVAAIEAAAYGKEPGQAWRPRGSASMPKGKMRAMRVVRRDRR